MEPTDSGLGAANESLIQELSTSAGELRDSLTDLSFYIELSTIGLAVTLAWFTGLLIRKRLEAAIQKHPPRRIAPSMLTKPLVLIAPLILLLLLGGTTPFIIQYSGGFWIDATVQITIAWIMARTVTLLVKTAFIGRLIAFVILAGAVLKASGLASPVTSYMDSLAFTMGDVRLSLLMFIQGVIILVLVFWLATLATRTLESHLRRSSSLSYTMQELTVKFFQLFIYFLATLITLSAVGIDITAFAVFGGAIGVGLGLGLQKVTSNFISGVTLLMEKSIKLGDIIEIGDIFGTVRQIKIRYTLVETPNGKELMIPNEDFVASRVTNWTFSNTRGRIDIPVGVAYGTDPDLVIKLLLEAATEHPKCLKDPAPNCWFREFGDSSLNFLLTFWVPNVSEGRWEPQSDVMKVILKKFDAHRIEIPFPQRVVHMHTHGK